MEYLYKEMNVMDNSINKMVGHLNKIIMERGRIVVRYHNDADGISSALLMYRMFRNFNINATFVQNNSAIYGMDDALRDIMYYDMGTHFIFLDFGNNLESLEGINILKREAGSIAIIDHHLTGKEKNEKNEKKTPLLLHASIPGAIDRDIYAVLEKLSMVKASGGIPEFPLWLAPTQLRLIPVSEDQVEYCESLLSKFKGKVRVDCDDRGESLGKKIRQAGVEWVPYVAVIGKNEIETGKLNVKVRGKEETLDLSVEDLLSEITTKTKKFPFEELSLPKLISKRFSF